ncbi:hypothetical protein STHAL_18155 [Streptomyces halstedii]|uniref:Uncharacterized protein n=1 Tax=Streptomyces halstedii TaxID=1944 RepID=A0ABS6TSX7_STRHA|nr:hypothetical protein [Streptomyces halstedii]MBV7671375.1 hypothetical protein [Streptomyces halstedii]
MTGQERPRLPQAEPHEARRAAEDYLGLGSVDVDVPRAIAWGLVAVAGELAAIRRRLK